MLRLSRFNFLVAVDGGSEDWLIYNALTDVGALLDASLARAVSYSLTRGPGRKPFWRYRNNAGSQVKLDCFADSLPAQVVAELRRAAILVDPIKEELCIGSIVDSYLRPSCLKLTIAFTARCQMSCSYCFQSGRDVSLRHDQDTVHTTIKWAGKYIKEHGLSALHLGLFGGEPLADDQIALVYAQEFKKLCEQLRVPLEISLTTNGLNLSNDILVMLIDCGLKYVRVTLDGPPAVHDLRRPTIVGGGTFERILANIKNAADLDGFGIGVAVNVDDTTSRSINDLLDILQRAGLKDDVEIILEPVMPQFAEHNRGTIDSENAFKSLAEAFHHVVERQFSIPLLPGMCGSCNVVQENCFVIDWSGDIFNCSFTMLEKGMSCGSVVDGLNKRELAAPPSAVNKLDRASDVLRVCMERQCPYLPICGGGCRYQAWLVDGDWSSPHCPEALFDKIAADAFAHSFGLKCRERLRC